MLAYPGGVSVSAAGDVYIADSSNFEIRKISGTTGIISTVAGTGTPGYSGDGGPALQARLSGVSDIYINALGVIFVVDGGNKVVREIFP